MTFHPGEVARSGRVPSAATFEGGSPCRYSSIEDKEATPNRSIREECQDRETTQLGAASTDSAAFSTLFVLGNTLERRSQAAGI